METDPLPHLLSLSWDVYFHPLTGAAAISLLLIALLLISSALISGSEVAYFSISPKDRQMLSNQKEKNSHFILHNLENPEKLLATILVANNFVNVGIVILSSYATDMRNNFV